MKNIEDNISLLVEKHFPQFYKDQGSLFVDFVREYYSWAQQSNNYLYYARNLIEYGDIDSTIDSFLVHFKEKYLVGSPLNQSKIKLDVKKAKDIYRSKGTERGTKLFLSREFGIDQVDIYYPGKDVIKASDGEWTRPQYLELSITEKVKTFIGQQITGSISGSTAFVTSVARRSINGYIFDVAIINDLVGDFITGENVTTDGVITDSPKIVGSLSSLSIIDPGKLFSKGNILDVISSRRGISGKARVDSITSSAGEASFTINDGGLGYTTSANVIVASKTIQVGYFESSNVFANSFLLEEIISQPMANISFNTSNTTFLNGEWVTSSNSTANTGSGILLSVDTSGTSGTFLVMVYEGSFTSPTPTKVIKSKFFNANSSVDANFITLQSNYFENNQQVLYTTATGNTVLTGLTNNTLYFVIGANTSGLKLSSSSGGSEISITSGLSEIGHILTLSTNPGAAISSVANRTASGRLIAANTDYIGLANVTNAFSLNNYNFISGSKTGVRSTILDIGIGSSASFSIGSIATPVTANLNTDLLRSNNSVNSPYMGLSLNAAQYNFPKLLTANLNNLSVSATFNSLTGVANTTEFITTTSAHGFSDGVKVQYLVSAGNTAVTGLANGTYYFVTSSNSTALKLSTTVGGSAANLTAGVSETGHTLTTPTATFNSLTGVANTTDFITTTLAHGFSDGNLVRYIVSAGNTAVTGLVNGTSYFVTSANSTALKLSTTAGGSAIDLTANVSETGHTLYIPLSLDNVFANSSFSIGTILSLSSINTGQGYSIAPMIQVKDPKVSGSFKTNLQLMLSGISGTFKVGENIIQSTTNAVGKVISISDDGTFIVIRQNSIKNFSRTDTITGVDTGATATVTAINPIENSLYYGYNANITSSVANGSITSLAVVGSGFGYQDGEQVILSSSNNTSNATATVNLEKQGISNGYFKTTKGFLNSDKYIHDGDFYQNYSYQIQSSVPLDVYADVLKELMHVAGTKMFGSVIRKSASNTQIQLVQSIKNTA